MLSRTNLAIALVSLLSTAMGATPVAQSVSPAVSAATLGLDDYSDGWEDGWAEGWKYVKGQYSIPPIAPVAPVPRPGQNKYKDGYNRGFVAGSARARRE